MPKSLIERRRKKDIDLFINQLKTREFLELDKAIEITKRTSGLYKCEIEAIINTLKDKNIKSMVEVGRCLGGSIYLYLCGLPIKKFLSIDIKSYITDTAIKEFMDYHNIENQILVLNSSTYVPKEEIWDFVFIDGDHTASGVRADISIWKDRCKYIGFHDFSDKYKNRHRRHYPEVVKEVQEASIKYKWTKIGSRGRSEIIFKT